MWSEQGVVWILKKKKGKQNIIFKMWAPSNPLCKNLHPKTLVKLNATSNQTSDELFRFFPEVPFFFSPSVSLALAACIIYVLNKPCKLYLLSCKTRHHLPLLRRQRHPSWTQFPEMASLLLCSWHQHPGGPGRWGNRSRWLPRRRESECEGEEVVEKQRKLLDWWQWTASTSHDLSWFIPGPTWGDW